MKYNRVKLKQDQEKYEEQQRLNKLKRPTTLDMEISLMQEFKFLYNSIVPNVADGIYHNVCGRLHECDLLVLSKTGYATEIEIKISKADLKKDKEKTHGHKSNLIKNLYFAVPEFLEEFALEEIPSRAGLVSVYFNGESFRCTIVRKPKQNKDCIKWDEKMRLKLLTLGTMRILGLKKNIQKLKDLNVKN